MEEAPENSKESSHSAHTNGVNELKLHVSVYTTAFELKYAALFNTINCCL